MRFSRNRRRRSQADVLRIRKQRQENLKKLRKDNIRRNIKYFMIGSVRYTDKNNKIKIVVEMQANSLINFCLDNNLDQVDFNYMAQVQDIDIFCFCLFNNADKKLYIQPLIVVNKTVENKDINLSLTSLINESVLYYFKDKNIKIKVFNQIWLFDILNKMLKGLGDFTIDFKVRVGKKSFFVTTFFSCCGCGFIFELSYKDAWMSSLQTDLKNTFLKFMEWAKILSNISKKEVWYNFNIGTFFPCSNITVWKKIVNHCALSNKFHLLDKDCDEEKNLNKLFKLTKHAPNKDGMFHFRNSIKIGYRYIGFLGVTFNKSGNSVLFLSILKSLNLFKEFEEDVAFISLTFL